MIKIGDTVKDIRNGKMGTVIAKKAGNNVDVAFQSHGWPETVSEQFLAKIQNKE